MKKDRNCGVPYPVYPAYQGMPYMPNMPLPNMGMPAMNVPYDTSTTSSNDQSIQNLREQISLLDKRVTNLENLFHTQNSTSQYSSSNYQMM